MGEKVVLREQVKELFNRKYGNRNEASADASGSAVARVRLTANVSPPTVSQVKLWAWTIRSWFLTS